MEPATLIAVTITAGITWFFAKCHYTAHRKPNCLDSVANAYYELGKKQQQHEDEILHRKPRHKRHC